MDTRRCRGTEPVMAAAPAPPGRALPWVRARGGGWGPRSRGARGGAAVWLFELKPS